MGVNGWEAGFLFGQAAKISNNMAFCANFDVQECSGEEGGLECSASRQQLHGLAVTSQILSEKSLYAPHVLASVDKHHLGSRSISIWLHI